MRKKFDKPIIGVLLILFLIFFQNKLFSSSNEIQNFVKEENEIEHVITTEPPDNVSITDISDNLLSSDYNIRLKSIRKAGQLKSCEKNICEKLINLLAVYKDIETQNSIKEALLSIGDKGVPVIFNYIITGQPILKEWTKELGKPVIDGTFIMRLEALLVTIGDESLPYLLEQRKSKEFSIKKQAGKIVGMMGIRSVPVLTKYLYSESLDEQIFAISAFEQLRYVEYLGDSKIKNYIKGFVFSKNQELRKVAFDAIILDKSVGKEDIIERLLFDNDSYIRSSTIAALYINNLRSEKIIKILFVILENKKEEEQVRYAALNMLDSLEADHDQIIKSVVPILYEGGELDLKILICDIIADYRVSTKTVVDALEFLQTVNNEKLRKKAVETLNKVRE